MSEQAPPNDLLNQHIPVDQKHITTKTKQRGGIPGPFAPYPGEMPGIRRTLYGSDEKERQLMQDSREPTPTLAEGLGMARQAVNNLREKYSLPGIPESDMQVALLDEESFHRDCKLVAARGS